VDVIGEYSEPPVQPDSFHVFFYADSGALPGTLVASRLANPYSGFIDFVITLTSPVTLTKGAYWVSVQAREDFVSSDQWFWDNRLVISNSGAAWQTPVAQPRDLAPRQCLGRLRALAAVIGKRFVQFRRGPGKRTRCKANTSQPK
jgi:hypothetical protein